MGSGHKTLLYGNAILLRHCNSNMVKVTRESLIFIYGTVIEIDFFSILLAFQAAPVVISWLSTLVCKNNLKVNFALNLE